MCLLPLTTGESLADYTPSQKKLIKQIIQIGKKRGESRKEIKAALETGRVEKNFSNTPGGDRDSGYWRQERASSYPGKDRSNSRASINRFYDETSSEGNNGRGKTSGQTAQAAQGSAFGGRYDEHSREAGQLLRKFGKGGGSSAGASRTKPGGKTIPGQDNSGMRKALLAQYLTDRGKPSALLQLASGLKDAQDTPDQKVSTGGGQSKPKRDTSSAGSSKAGVVKMDGYEVNASIAADLKAARKAGWKGKVTSGYRSNKDQARVCATGVKPCAPVGQSMHRFKRPGKGAVDVSDGAGLGRYLPKSSKLRHAGSSDPPHWSQGAPGGSY